MKTYNQIGIKIILFVFAVVLLNNCKKNEDADFVLQNEWKVKSIHTDKETLKVSSGNIRKDAYILKFINDTTFSLPTSVNYAGGKYVIASNGNVRINYNISTEICCENNFDEQMINVINKVNTYYCKGNELTFLTKENEKIIFEKQ